MQSTASDRWPLVCDAVGMLVIAAQLYLLARWLAPKDGAILGVLAFIVLAGAALYYWHKDSAEKQLVEPVDWVAAIGASFVMGGFSFGIDMLVGLMSHPKLSPIEAGTKAVGPFGFGLTLMICPGLTVLAIAGLARALLLHSRVAPTS